MKAKPHEKLARDIAILIESFEEETGLYVLTDIQLLKVSLDNPPRYGRKVVMAFVAG